MNAELRVLACLEGEPATVAYVRQRTGMHEATVVLARMVGAGYAGRCGEWFWLEADGARRLNAQRLYNVALNAAGEVRQRVIARLGRGEYETYVHALAMHRMGQAPPPHRPPHWDRDLEADVARVVDEELEHAGSIIAAAA